MTQPVEVVTPKDAFTIVPTDNEASANFKGCDAIWVGGPGNVRVKTFSGTDHTFNNATGGSYISMKVLGVYATGTTATLLSGLLY